MTMASKFPGTCRTCGTAFPAGTVIHWTRASGAKHADLHLCASLAAAPPAPTASLDAAPIATFLQAAQARGLKYPKVRFLTTDQRELRLSLAGPSSRYPGAVQVKVDGEWLGRIELGGRVAGPLAGAQPILDTLTTIAADPAAAAKAYGALTCRCSFCHLPLTDAGSVDVGYGRICAERFNLPHTQMGTPRLSPYQVAA